MGTEMTTLIPNTPKRAAKWTPRYRDLSGGRSSDLEIVLIGDLGGRERYEIRLANSAGPVVGLLEKWADDATTTNPWKAYGKRAGCLREPATYLGAYYGRDGQRAALRRIRANLNWEI